MIGTFGNIAFETSTKKVLTFDEFERVTAAIFAEHKVIDQKPKLQLTGLALDQITFSIFLSAFLGVDPADEIQSFKEIAAKGEARKLIMGGQVVGDFVLVNMTEKWSHVNARGKVVTAMLNITLKEYV